MRARWIALGLVASPTLASSLGGTYRAVLPEESVRELLETEVEEAAQTFSVFTRPIARPKLKRAAQYCLAMEVKVTEDTFEARCDGQTGLTRPINAEEVPFETPVGRVMTRVVREGSAVTLWLDGETGSRKSVYRFEDAALVMDVSVSSEWLDEPMTWSLRYLRAP